MKTHYDSLAIMPSIIAEVVAGTPYTGVELSNPDPRNVIRIERLRRQMSKEQMRIFADWCDRRCRYAYEARVKWFLKCVKSNDGREALKVYLSHWLAAFLQNPHVVERD